MKPSYRNSLDSCDVTKARVLSRPNDQDCCIVAFKHPKWMLLANTVSETSSAGDDGVLIPKCKEAVPGVECDAKVCFLDPAAIGIVAAGPRKQVNSPDVGL